MLSYYEILKEEFNIKYSFEDYLLKEFIVFENGKAFCFLKKYKDNYHIFYLISKEKRKGYSKELINTLKVKLELPITTNVRNENIASKSLFTSLGFQELYLNNYYSNKDKKITFYYAK